MSTTVLTKPIAPISGMAEATGLIVAYAEDEVTEAALRTGLAGIGGELRLRRGGILNAIKFLERETAPQAIIVDISGVDDPLSALEHLARVCPPDVAVVAVGTNADIAFYRLLLNEVGVAEYLPKPITRDTVERLLIPLFLPDRPNQSLARGAHVIAVCGASGGAGATTLAVNTALALAGVAKGNVAMLDLNLQHGAAAVMLGSRPGPGLRIALEDPDQADTLLLERSAIQVAPRMRLIAAAEPLSSGVGITETGVRQVLELIRQKFNFLVVDLPMPPRPELHQVLSLARHVVVVLKPDVASVRNAREIRQLALQMAGSDRIITIENFSNARGRLPPKILETALGGEVHIRVPDLGPRMTEAVNQGIPALRRVPELHKLLGPLIQEIAAIKAVNRSPSWLRRMFSR